MTSLPAVLLTEFVPPIAYGLAQRCTVLKLWEADDKDAFLEEHAQEITIIAAGPKGLVDRKVIESLPRLQLIAKFGAGYEQVDVEAARGHGIIVSNTPGVMAGEVADFAIGLLLSFIREIPAAQAFVREGAWVPDARFKLTASLRERRVGIAGLGRIGIEIARRLEGFGVPIAYHNRGARADVSYPFHASILELAKAVDTLILAVPGGEGTRAIVNADVLAALGPQGVLINVARGSVIDQAALIEALRGRKILGAALDSIDGEPHVPEALLSLENVLITPHVGSGSVTTVLKMCQLVVDNIFSWIDGKGPLTAVPETPFHHPKSLDL